jgi:hypothetical protein
MSLLPSNTPVINRIPRKVVNQDATIKDLNGIMQVDTQAGIDKGKGNVG